MKNSWVIAVMIGAMVLGAGVAVQAWNEEGGEKDEALELVPNLENGRNVYEVCAA